MNHIEQLWNKMATAYDAFSSGKNAYRDTIEWPCIQSMLPDITGKSVIDLGCGSGILSIASLLLEAKEADAVDIDPNAINIAYENSDMNDIPREKYHVCAGNILEDAELHQKYSGKKYDMVEANIVADIIIALTKQVPDYIKDGGIFLSSGIITERKEDVLAALEAGNSKVEAVRDIIVMLIEEYYKG